MGPQPLVPMLAAVLAQGDEAALGAWHCWHACSHTSPSLAIPSQGWVQAANPANGPKAPQLQLGTPHSTAPAPGSSQGRDKASPGAGGAEPLLGKRQEGAEG